MGLFDEGIFGSFGKKGFNEQIDELIANKPKYKINDEYGDNQGIARGKAYGRNRAFQLQEENIDQNSANAGNQVQQFASSTSGILNTLASITGNKNQALRGLGQDEAQYQGAALNDVMGANTAMAEEKDKAWNYNVNEPFQLKLNQLVQQKKARAELFSKIFDTLGTVGSFALGGPAGLAAKTALSGIGKKSSDDLNL